MAELLGELLYSLRSSARLSQEALAERSGVSARTISDIETGSARTPRLITVMLLGEAMGLSPPDQERLKDAARKPDAPPVDANFPASLLLQAAALVGRDDDVARAGALLRENARLVTLVGPAGVGKTSLAIKVALECAGDFEHGTAIAELSPIADPAHVPAVVARALGHPRIARHARDRNRRRLSAPPNTAARLRQPRASLARGRMDRDAARAMPTARHPCDEPRAAAFAGPSTPTRCARCAATRP